MAEPVFATWTAASLPRRAAFAAGQHNKIAAIKYAVARLAARADAGLGRKKVEEKRYGEESSLDPFRCRIDVKGRGR